MKRVLKKFSVLFLAMGLATLNGCNYKDFIPSDNPPKGDIFDDLDLRDKKDLDLAEGLKYHSNQDYDVDNSHPLVLGIKEINSPSGQDLYGALLDGRNNEDYFVVKDSEGGYINMITEESVEEGLNVIVISPDGVGYQDGSIIKISLTNQDLYFYGKDPNIRDYYLTVKQDEEVAHLEISDDVPFFDVNKVTYFPIPDGDYPSIDNLNSEEAAEFFNTATYHFGYSDNSFGKLHENDHFGVSLIKKGLPDISSDSTFYGKFVAMEKEGETYKITYKNADLTQIFRDSSGNPAFEFVQKEEEAPIKNFQVTALKQEYEKAFKASPDVQRFAAAVAEVADNGVTPKDILNNFSVDFNFSIDDTTIDFQVDIGGTYFFGDENKYAIKVGMTFQYSISLSTSGGVKIKKFLGVPYWIKAYGDVTKTTDFKFTFYVSFAKTFNPTEIPGPDEMKDAITKAYDKLENDPAYFMPRVDDPAIVSGNHISQPLCSLDVPFGYIFDFHLGLSFEFTLDLNIMLRYGYESHSVEKMLGFSTEDGMENTGNTTECSASTHNLDIGGKLYVEVGLKLTISVGIVGLKSLFTLGVSIGAGLYVKLTAMGGVSFGDDQETVFYGGIDFDIGIYFSLDGFMDFLVVFHPKYNFAKYTWSMLELSTRITILDMYAEDISLSQYETDIATTKLLMVKQFNTDDFNVSIKDYQLNSVVKVVGDREVQPLSLESNSKYLSFDEDKNTIVVSENAPANFSGTITVNINSDVNWYSYGADSKTINFTYTAYNAHKVQIGDDASNTLYFRTGDELVLPTPVNNPTLDEKATFSYIGYDNNGKVSFGYEYDDEVYDFLCYTDGYSEYQPGQTYTFPDRDIKLTVKLYKIVYYTVSFYNGNNDFIKSYKVREKTASPEPTEEERYMEGYLFYGWDRDISYVTTDMNVYGIYVRGGSQA